ncbi:manganese efflux pump MntP [Alicyclobacillus dauci]|uniref:Manganese efflux pump MntP family protein n=1 Tax=Alicyclobacillus dauci TaxID=1475485 RepID=A0ABY6Z5P8_9BACL|nr:manganese efflux pump [Alicyclobacillus dauci]WAH38190.1 manganese efflux pump MntP family protein [Alicyclobacillus dauci]
MLVLQLILFGLAMGANNALASVALGTSQLSRVHQLRTALIFAVFEAIMPIVGMAIGESVAGGVGNKARWIGIAVLVIMGIYSLVKRDGGDDETDKAVKAKGASILFLAVALSLDNLTVGFGIGMFNAPIALAAVIFGVVSLMMTLIGLEIGRFLGKRLSISADKLSGVVLLVVAGVMAFA